MKKTLLSVLLAAGLLGALMGVLSLPASAELRTVTVRLADGRLVTVTVDVPPGTPLEDIPLPSLPIDPPELPIPLPTDEQPAPAETPGTGEQPAADETPTADANSEQKPSGDKTKATPGDADAPTAEPEAEVKRKLKQLDEKFRNKDGSPAMGNPGYFDALPGPAYATGIPNFVIRKFRVPIFLLPIYQAAGIQYGIRWEVLAAINEIETDYGRNLNVSSAGAVGWMQFMPATWRMYGVDANKDGRKDPFNPVDAIFAAARYLRAAGAQDDIKRAIFAYNHADWYVDSVVMRARLIAGVPADLVGSLTGLTEGRFPVYARARYADDLAERDAVKRVRRGANAARVVDGDENRRGIDIFARKGSPVVAVGDGIVKKVGANKKLGRFVVLQDVYGNRYTYAGLGRVSRFYPVAKSDPGDARTHAKALAANAAKQPKRDPKPTAAASAGRQLSEKAAGTKVRLSANSRKASDSAPQPKAVERRRLFANPNLPAARKAGGLEQILTARAEKGGYATFRGRGARPLKFDPKRMKLKALKKGSRIVGGTVLGRIGKTSATKAPHVYFEIRPAGRGAPRIDPKPILDGWKLLEATAIYRASGRNALYDPEGDDLSVGQVMLLPKHLLERRVLSDPRIEIYDGGRGDIRTGQIDRRVLATLEYLAESGLRPAVTSLKTGHGFFTKSGNVSHHSSGNAVDIASINGIPILGHQEAGGITEQTVRRLLLLQGTMRPTQIISLLDMGSNTFSMGDHADHIHVGWRPLFGDNKKLGMQALAVLKPGQWSHLIDQLNKIENPVVPTKPSKFAIKVKRHRASHAHAGD
jgi:hypothetical protein